MLTDHGRDRVAKRTGVGKKAAERLVAKARAEGRPRETLSGGIRWYLDAKYHNQPTPNDLVVYHGNVYVFADARYGGSLITMFPLPRHLRGVNV